MFRRLTMAIFRLYTKYLASSYTGLIWAVYSGEVGVEVGTRSRMCYVPPHCIPPRQIEYSYLLSFSFLNLKMAIVKRRNM